MRPAVVAACEWLLIASLVALAAILGWRGALAIRRRLQSADLWRPLRWILLGSFVLNLLGIRWGLPGRWVPIELLPEYIGDGLAEHFSHGWFDAYPPLHYYILSTVMAPFLWLSWWGRLAFDDRVYNLLVLLNRLVSVAAGVGCVAATGVAGALAFGRRPGLWAAAIMALTTPFLYYAKTTNPDVPYLFWFAVSLVYYVRILQGGTRRDYVLFAAFATFSVCTKDQAYGLYLLMPVPIVVEIWRANRSANRPRAFLRALIDPRLWIAAATSAVLFALIHNMLFNWNGFMQHVRFITGDGSAPYRVFEPTLAGRWKLFLLTLDLTQQSLGWPFSIAALYGLVYAIVRPETRRLSLWLLVPVVSYYFSFIDVIVYNYDRFMLPVCLILALFGGVTFDELTAPRDMRTWRVALASAVFAYTLFYAGAVDYLMIHDSRYHAERWLRAHVGPGQIVGTSGTREYIPNLDGLSHTDVPNLETLDRVRPAFVLFNADYGRAVPRETGWGQLIAALQQGTAGYKLVARFRDPLPWAWLPGMHRDLVGPRSEHMVFTTVRNINPTIEVYAPQ
ncbi:MAG TPA: glycosyltransferase family 39 protein [Vicinamibacterales bacterium]